MAVLVYYLLDTIFGGILGGYLTAEEAVAALEEDTAVICWEDGIMRVIAEYGKTTEES